jgi:hypothetical protein
MDVNIIDLPCSTHNRPPVEDTDGIESLFLDQCICGNGTSRSSTNDSYTFGLDRHGVLQSYEFGAKLREVVNPSLLERDTFFKLYKEVGQDHVLISVASRTIPPSARWITSSLLR